MAGHAASSGRSECGVAHDHSMQVHPAGTGVPQGAVHFVFAFPTLLPERTHLSQITVLSVESDGPQRTELAHRSAAGSACRQRAAHSGAGRRTLVPRLTNRDSSTSVRVEASGSRSVSGMRAGARRQA